MTLFCDADTFAKTQRMLWLVDWSDVKIGIAGTNSVTRTQPHPEVDRLYSCRMDSVKRLQSSLHQVDNDDGSSSPSPYH